MRQVSIIFLLTALILVLNPQMAISAIKGGIEYSIPVDYSKLSEEEIEKKALYYYELAKRLPDDTVNEDMTNALFHYSILHQMSTGNPEYYVRLGFLYDKLHKDKMAKSCFTRAIQIKPNDPKCYFYLGEYYYRRGKYRKAILNYNKAYSLGSVTDYNLLYKMGDTYEKLGDSRSALKYLEEALKQSPNPELENQIKRIEAFDQQNKEYYLDTRIRG